MQGILHYHHPIWRWEIIRKVLGKVGAGEVFERWATGSLFKEVCQTFGLIVRAK